MPRFEGFEAWISTATGRLAEYSPKTEGVNVSVFVESSEGAEFRPSFSRTGFHDGTVEGILTIDGERYRGKVSKKATKIATWTGARNSTTTERPFTFARLETTDDDAVVLSEKQLKGLGEITLTLWRVFAFNKHDLDRHREYDTAGAIYEGSKKARLSSVTSLGAERAIVNKGAYRTQKLGTEPLVTFRFLYRSKDILEAEGLLTPGPAAAANKRERSFDTPPLPPDKKPKAERKPVIDIDELYKPDVKPKISHVKDPYRFSDDRLSEEPEIIDLT